MLKRMVPALVIGLGLVFISPLAHAGFLIPEVRFDLGLGYGKTTLEYGELDFAPQSVAGHAGIHVQWLIFMVGASYMTTTQLNIGDERTYASMSTVDVGLALGRRLELIGGVGMGKWRRKRMNELTTPSDSDYIGFGSGYMAGIRIYLFSVNQVSVGLSATYYRMSEKQFTSIEDGVQTEPMEDARGTGSIAAVVFRWTPGKGKKSK